MAIWGYKMPLIAFLLGALLWAQASAQQALPPQPPQPPQPPLPPQLPQPPQPAQPGCTTAMVNLAPCLSFITGNSSAPPASCCSQFSSMVQNQTSCLCTFLNGAIPFPIAINQTLALTLPNACNIQTPPVGQCNAVAPAAIAPAAVAPATSPAAATPEKAPVAAAPASPSGTSTPTVPSQASSPKTSSVPITPSGNGSKTVPSTTGQSSDASSTKSTLSLFFILLFVASHVSLNASF